MVERDRDALGRPEQARPRDRTGRPLPYDTDEVLLVEDHAYDTLGGALATGVALWDQQRFFEAHECLEDVWHAAADPDTAQRWKGVIQVAVGCVHQQRGNHRGAVTLWRRAAARLAGAPPSWHGLRPAELATWATDAARTTAAAGRILPVPPPRFPAEPDGPWVHARGAAPTPLPEGTSLDVAVAQQQRRRAEAAS